MSLIQYSNNLNKIIENFSSLQVKEAAEYLSFVHPLPQAMLGLSRAIQGTFTALKSGILSPFRMYKQGIKQAKQIRQQEINQALFLCVRACVLVIPGGCFMSFPIRLGASLSLMAYDAYSRENVKYIIE
jgi:hypothetical protein